MRQRTPNPDILDVVAALRRDEPASEELQAAGARAWKRVQATLGDPAYAHAVEHIRGCEDVRALLPAYRTGNLTAARALLVDDHLRECISCRRHAHGEQDIRESARSWKPALPAAGFSPWTRWAMAAMLLVALGLAGYFVTDRYLAVPAGNRATVQAVEGQIYRVSPGGEQLLSPGAQVVEGESLRTAGGSHAFVRLMDGSVVEMNERTELSVSARWKDTTVHLDGGRIIVQAAKRRKGRLYVAARDCRVAVTGTVFSVNSGLKGSRVAVVEGEVHVEEAGQESVLHSGDQTSTSEALGYVPVEQEISWSRNLDQHLALLAEFASLSRKLENVHTPPPRFESRILPLVPATAVVYASIPNLGEALTEASQIFQEQLRDSAVLRQWWEQANRNDRGPSLSEGIEKLRALSRYLGEEVVFTAFTDAAGENHGPIFLANIKQSGLRDFLEQEIARMSTGSDGRPDFTVLEPAQLATADPSALQGQMLILVRPDMVIAATDLGTLRVANASVNAGGSGFGATPFGQTLLAAYGRGAGVLLGVNLEAITQAEARRAKTEHGRAGFEASGFSRARYLLIERRENNGQVDNRAVLDFAGQRSGMASWLGAPAPMNSLQFVSANASLSFSFIAKSPALMLDDLLATVQAGNPKASQEIAELESRLNLRLREDLAATLGGDVTIALDGPVLPTPSWKLVAEVYDANRLQSSIQKLVEACNRKAAEHGRPGWVLQESQLGSQTYYSVRSLRPQPMAEVHYAYADGYLIAAPTRALVAAALQARDSGNTLANSSTLRSLLPRDQHTSFSGLVYQNVAPVLQPLSGYLSSSQMASLQKIAAESKPSVIAAYGESDRIEVASSSRFFGFDLNTLTLSTLMGRGRGTAAEANP